MFFQPNQLIYFVFQLALHDHLKYGRLLEIGDHLPDDKVLTVNLQSFVLLECRYQFPLKYFSNSLDTQKNQR